MADLHTDVWSINDLVQRAQSKDEATKSFYNLQGISLPYHTANLVFTKAVENKFQKREAQATYKKQIEAKYHLVEAVLDAETIKQSIEMLKKHQKFKELKKYYDTVRKDLIDSGSLSQEEASSLINYAIHK
jgi:type II secretory pathway component PulF